MKPYKLIFTAPESHAAMIRKALSEAGAGIVGKYTHCSYSVSGTTRFLPEPGADPTDGEVGELEEATEERIEFLVARDNIHKVIETLKKVHPYEEITYDVIERLDF